MEFSKDYAPELVEITEAGRVGLPCIVIGNGEKILFDYNLLDIDSLEE